MGLIIKDKIAQLKKGYPTVSDKYNVQGGVYEGDDALYFGDILVYGSATGHYLVADNNDVEEIAGICLATNVKLANRYPGDSNSKVETLKGEAFNLLVRGFVAVAIAVDAAGDTPTAEEIAATAALCKEGAPVYFDGTMFTADDAAAQVPGVYFMGVTEVVEGQLLAEINYKM